MFNVLEHFASEKERVKGGPGGGAIGDRERKKQNLQQTVRLSIDPGDDGASSVQHSGTHTHTHINITHLDGHCPNFPNQAARMFLSRNVCLICAM